MLFLAGGHFRWTGSDTVEAEGYVINRASESFSQGSFYLHAALEGADRVRSEMDVIPSGLDWPPGEVRKFSATFSEVSRASYRLEIVSSEFPKWFYVTECLNPELVVDPDGCPRLYDTPFDRITPAIEAQELPRLLECCQWTPPPLDAYDFHCRLKMDITCSATVWNFRNTTAEATGEIILYDQDPNNPDVKRELTRETVDLGDAYAAGEAREITLTLPASTILLEPTANHALDLRISLKDTPRSTAWETTELVVAEVGE